MFRLIRRMAAEMSGDSLVKVGYAKNMERINNSYWNSKVYAGSVDTSSFDMSANVLEYIKDEPSTIQFRFGGSSTRPTTIDTGSIPTIGFKGGRFRLTSH